MITSLSGPYTPLGTNDKLGAEQEVNAINTAGGIGGRKIDLVIEAAQKLPKVSVGKCLDPSWLEAARRQVSPVF